MDYKRKHTHANSGTGNYFLIYGPWKPISTRAISVLKAERKMAQIPATDILATWSDFLLPDFAPFFFAALRTLVVTGRDGIPRAINQKIIPCA